MEDGDSVTYHLNVFNILVDKEQWAAVDPSTKPTGVLTEDWEKLDRKARNTIHLCLSDSVLLNVSGEDCTNNLWES